MEHAIRLKIRRPIEVLHSDIEIVVRQDRRKLGTLTISKGSIDWRPKHAKVGKKGETQKSWSDFAKLMEEANDR